MRIRPRRIEPPAGARNTKKINPQIIFNNPRSSIKTESTPDPLFKNNKRSYLNIRSYIKNFFEVDGIFTTRKNTFYELWAIFFILFTNINTILLSNVHQHIWQVNHLSFSQSFFFFPNFNMLISSLGGLCYFLYSQLFLVAKLLYKY